MFGATNRTPLKRTVPLKRSPFKPKPKRRDYGGPVSQELGGTAEKFRKLVRERDGVCLLCESPSCLPLTVAHLSEKVKMGGRRTSTVNTLENACALGWPCHQLQEVSRTITAALVRKLVRRYGYEIE